MRPSRLMDTGMSTKLDMADMEVSEASAFVIQKGRSSAYCERLMDLSAKMRHILGLR